MASLAKTFVPWNEIEGTASTNVPAYSNRNSSIFNIGFHYVHGVYTGFQWQCVEYARRWLLLRKSCIFGDVRNACNIWTNIRHVERITDGKEFPLRAVPNGSPNPPKVGSLLIYVRSRKMPFGHVAVITDVVNDYVHIAEQNNLFHYWTADYARRAPLRFRDGLYYIEDEDKIFGWMEIEDHDELKPFDEAHKDQILAKYLQPQSVGLFGRLLGWNKRKREQ